LFDETARASLLNQEWTLSPSSDRTGYRMTGASLGSAKGTIASEPVLPGSIQVPPDGLPIVTMRDGPTVGGYPKLALIDPPHLSWLTQCRPGQRIRFVRAPGAR
jgi:antagonist of KipI